MHAVWERRVAFGQRQRQRNLSRLQRIAGGGQAFQRSPYAAADLGEGRGVWGPLYINVTLPVSSQAFLRLCSFRDNRLPGYLVGVLCNT